MRRSSSFIFFCLLLLLLNIEFAKGGKNAASRFLSRAVSKLETTTRIHHRATPKRKSVQQPSELQTEDTLRDPALTILHANVRGLRTRACELCGLIRTLDNKPGLLCLNETFLDPSVKDVQLEGYEIVARHDRKD